MSERSLVVSSSEEGISLPEFSEGDEVILTFGTTEEPFIF
jgi:hypothetical protein